MVPMSSVPTQSLAIGVSLGGARNGHRSAGQLDDQAVICLERVLLLGPEPFLTACERLGVAPERTLMVGNNRLADSGSICVGCFCLILPPVPPGATRGLRAAADVAGIAWAE
jgi:hypothetical protein